MYCFRACFTCLIKDWFDLLLDLYRFGLAIYSARKCFSRIRSSPPQTVLPLGVGPELSQPPNCVTTGCPVPNFVFAQVLLRIMSRLVVVLVAVVAAGLVVVLAVVVVVVVAGVVAWWR